MGGDFAFDLGHARERLIPTRLQFASHQPIDGSSGFVLQQSPSL
jgi:hypothetical protein